MAKVNGKMKIVDYENSIKKSNELSMAKLSQGLTLNQMQLLAYAIFCTQQDGKTEFNKADFEKKFGLEKYQTVYIKEDIDFFDTAIFSLIKIDNLEKEFIKRRSIKIFRDIEYNKGLFSFEWDAELLPHIIDLKEKYVLTDLTITSHFKSGFSWILYDFLKGLYGYWYKPISKESLMQIFGVEDKKTYQSNTGLFKKYVLDVAIAEINEHTELQVHYKEQKEGRKITGFNIYWSSGKKVASATKKQIEQLKVIIDIVVDDFSQLTNLKDKQSKQKAISYLRDIQAMGIDIKEPISITADYASELIHQANEKLRLLDTMHKKENTGRDTSIYYDWLNGE